jgi:nitronate monooxygenase
VLEVLTGYRRGSEAPALPGEPRPDYAPGTPGGGEDTERSRVSDIARGAPWPAKYAPRTLRTWFFDQWRGREDELAADSAAQQAYQQAVAAGDLPPEPVWASEAIDLITEMSPAADLVGALAEQAEEALARARNHYPRG